MWLSPVNVFRYFSFIDSSCYAKFSNEYCAPVFPGPDEHACPADENEDGENTRCRTPNVAQYATRTHCFNDIPGRVVSFGN